MKNKKYLGKENNLIYFIQGNEVFYEDENSFGHKISCKSSYSIDDFNRDILDGNLVEIA